MSARLSHLQELQAESLHIFREVVAECSSPVLLYSEGKESAVLLHLAWKAFYPARIPFPVLHVDTTWNFRETIDFRDKLAQRLNLELLVYKNTEALAEGINPFDHASSHYTSVMKTKALNHALDKYGFTTAFTDAHQDEETLRAKERVFSMRAPGNRWEPKFQRPELWSLYNVELPDGWTMKVFPLANWTERDIWRYIEQERIDVVPLYFAAMRPVVRRNGFWIMVDDGRMRLRDGECPEHRMVRFRAISCYPLTAAVESTAQTLKEIMQEALAARTPQWQNRVIDYDDAGPTECEKTDGWL